jgi:hypothetical protein
MSEYRAYLSHQEIYYALEAASEQDWRVVTSPSKPPLADRFREWARRALALGIPVEHESLRLEWALAMGGREDTDYTDHHECSESNWCEFVQSVSALKDL